MSRSRLRRRFRVRSPLQEIVSVDGDAEEIGCNKPGLRGAERDDADQDAVHAGNDPALPKAASHQDGGENRERAGDVVETQHLL